MPSRRPPIKPKPVVAPAPAPLAPATPMAWHQAYSLAESLAVALYDAHAINRVAYLHGEAFEALRAALLAGADADALQALILAAPWLRAPYRSGACREAWQEALEPLLAGIQPKP